MDLKEFNCIEVQDERKKLKLVNCKLWIKTTTEDQFQRPSGL